MSTADASHPTSHDGSPRTEPRHEHLPSPQRTRWQPLRAGLVDLYYYDDQEFWFHDGRLLLRGNNGAGKSKVLALLLPFLLDGETAGHRLEPDGDAAKKMEWNLLLGGEHPNPERTGYSWLELGRLDEQGRAHHRTIGFGVKAARGRGVVKRWFFTADARVGLDLHLVDTTRTVLTQERLDAALAALPGVGRVTTTARAHRAAVDELFFGLGEQRYSALVDLLVQLRQPQLSRRPSESRLSEALTAALPPLEQGVLSNVAESYRSLDEDRAALERTRAAHAGARAFLGHYRRYAEVAVRRAAEPPRRLQSRYETTRTALTGAQRSLEDAEAAVAAAVAREQAAAQQVVVLRARELALAGDPRHRAIEVLEQAREAEVLAAREVEASQRRTQEAQRRRDASQLRADAATQAADAARRRTERAASDADDAAREARMPELVQLLERSRGAAGQLEVSAPPDDLRPWQRAAGAALERRRRDLDHVDALASAQRTAEAARAEAERDTDRAAAALSGAQERCAQAERTQADEGAALLRASAVWAGGLVELRLPDPAGLLASLEAWLSPLDGEAPTATAAAEARAAAAAGLVVEREQRRREADTARAAAAALAEELAALERGEHTPPAASPTRDPAARAAATGAPLWQLVEPTDGLGEQAAAGLEAALEAAGLLDAWVGADASLRLADDVVLHPVAAGADRPTRSLAEVLVPGDALPLPTAVVADLLASIGLGAPPQESSGRGRAPVWVDVDGSFGTPVSTGSWHRAASEHLGAASRERRRLARIASARTELAEVRQAELDAESAADALGLRLQAAGREAAVVPSARAVLDAARTLAALVEQRTVLREAVVVAERQRAAAAEAAAEAATSTASAAAELALPAQAEQRTALRRAADAWERALAVLWPALEVLRRAGAEVDERDATATEHAAAADEEAGELARRRSVAASAAETSATMRRTRGQDADELTAEREEVERLQQQSASEHQRATAALTRAAEGRGAAQDRVATLTTQLTEHTADRDDAVARWQAVAATGLVAVAVPALEVPPTSGHPPHQRWAPDPAVRLARAVEQALEGVAADDDALDRVKNRVTTEQRGLDDVLAQDGHRASLRSVDDQLHVEVVFRGRPAGLVELEASLGADVTDRTRLLDAREREVIETYLVEEVATTLADLVSGAEAQVERMNAELRARPTSTGMRLRLRWLPREDGPPGLEAARARLLRQHADAWSSTDRAAVAAFLTGQVQAVRAADPGGSWLEQLATALDYRSWHRFAVQRWQAGQWKSASGPASGGERVLAASVPLFAAASAHYGSAPNPHAPRLVMLDEAFAGVDDTARADYLGLLAAFDLDVVMTSEREWGCYPQVPGLGIAQLSRLEGIDAVLVTPWRWDGRTRQRADVGTPGLPPPRREVRSPDEEGAQDGLFE